MFKKMLRELEQLNGKSLSIPIETDADGYLDRECPANACLFTFKVFADDWRDICRDEEIFCPMCRHAAPAKKWYTTEQVQAAENYARNHIIKTINGAMRADAKDWNRRQPRNTFLKITMDVNGARDPVLVPITAAEPMRLKSRCDTCGCRYSYIGAAYFCPACGANSARHTFQQTLDTIRSATAVGEVLRGALDADQAEVLTRSLLEKGMQDAVMSFQRLAEQSFAALPNQPAARRNAFQNLDEGAALWAKATGVTFLDALSSSETLRLRKYYQQRHLLAHRQGMVDQEYLTRCSDTSYAIGQRVIINKEDVLDFVALIERIGAAISPPKPDGA